MARRIIAIIFSLITCMITFTSCSKKTNDLTMDNIVTMIEQSGSFSDMKKLSNNQLSNYFDLASGAVIDSTMYISSKETVADEFVIFQVANDDNIQSILSSIAAHMSIRQTAFRNISEFEYQKLQNAVISKMGNFIVVVVNENYEKIISELKKNGATTIK